MKMNSATGKGIHKLFGSLFLATLLLSLSTNSYAHKVERYTVSCFFQGGTVTINTKVGSTGYNSYIHWQYRVSPGSPWVYLANGNNMINGHVFSVAGASQPTFIQDSIDNLVINDAGSPAYTSQLDNIELRILMTDFGLDPETHPWPSIPVYGAEEYGDKDAKYIRIRTRPAGENCYSSCTNNMLVINPGLVPPPITDYFGGFEVSGTGNFSAPGTNGVTTRAYTDIAQWTSGTLGTNARYRIINNPDSMNTTFSAFAPHSGMNMMVVNANNSCINRIWYRTIAVSNANEFFQGTMIFRAWFSKPDIASTNPTVMLELKGAATVAAASLVSLGTVTQTISGTPGTWVQLALVVNIPVNSYKKLEISIKTPNACGGNPAYLAIDDLCLLEPISGLLPIVMTPLKASYSNGIAQLSWSSMQELNSNYYEIQKSTDGANFISIGNVVAKGHSEIKTDYRFNDIHASSGVNYYRLKQVDKDGTSQYSNIAALNVNIKGVNIVGVYPAPFTDKINVTLSSETAGTAVMYLYDNMGKRLAAGERNLTKGVNNLVLDGLATLPKGFYIFKVQVGDEFLVKKLTK